MTYLAVASGDREEIERARATCGRIVQSASPRVFLCEGQAELSDLQSAGLRIVRSAADFNALAGELTEGEALFIRGWLERHRTNSRSRKGDGLDWDTPPYESP